MFFILKDMDPSSLKKSVFSMAVVTNYNKLSSLKQHTFILSYSSGGQESKVSFSRIGFLLEAPGGDLFFAFSASQRLPPFLRLMSASL